MSSVTLSIFCICTCFIVIINAANMNCTVQQNIDYYQSGNPSAPCDNAQDCCNMCFQRVGCNYWTLYGGLCYFKETNQGQQASDGRVSGHCLDKSNQTYILNLSASGNTFFDNFVFLQDEECVQGSFTDFIANLSYGESMGYINTTANSVYIGTDMTHVLPNNAKGRTGICIGTKQLYKNGLFILHASHMPYGCGVWPSWWMTDGDYTAKVCEIDTIEGINLFNDDRTTLHTKQTCDYSSQQGNIQMTGKWDSTNCDDSYNVGCSIEPNVQQSYGVGFNSNGGGVFAHENNPNLGIVRMWFFTNDQVPDDIKQKKPDPNNWGKPYAAYPSGSWCPQSIFNTQKQLRLDIYFCGWAGADATWNQQCSGTAQGKSCNEFVGENPTYFKDAYWAINYMDIYQLS
eukprot:55063_1